jgi:hypothetical protein
MEFKSRIMRMKRDSISNIEARSSSRLPGLDNSFVIPNVAAILVAHCALLSSSIEQVRSLRLSNTRPRSAQNATTLKEHVRELFRLTRFP